MIKGNSSSAGGYHAWNSVYDVESDSWVNVDTTLNLGSTFSAYKVNGGGYSMTSSL
jgi:hypothetical protein